MCKKNRGLDSSSILNDFHDVLGSESISVLLAGSFSRNEHSYYLQEDKITPLSDIEFFIICNIIDYFVGRKKIKALIGSVKEKYQIKVDYSFRLNCGLLFYPMNWLWYETILTDNFLIDNLNVKAKLLSLINYRNVNSGEVNETFFHSINSLNRCLASNKDIFFIKYSIIKLSMDLLIPVLYKRNKTVCSHCDRLSVFLDDTKNDDIDLDNNVRKLLTLMKNLKCIERVIPVSSLDEYDVIDLLKMYKSFYEFCFYDVFGCNVNKFNLKINLGNSSYIRKLQHFKSAIMNIVSWRVILGKYSPAMFTYINYIHLVNACSEQDQYKRLHFRMGKEIIEYYRSDYGQQQNIFKLIYKYLR